ncbi:unnamed protein product [Psylliodes chrysocephalus]|uniref:Serpin domain-containing protein n=1 Tax=Psylliodes chrysocephalus TaxID=3402493 RepID=A0A9P0CS14_9CUCU|nr:unnamed protein product [Psylliodes chrysocephala]
MLSKLIDISILTNVLAIGLTQQVSFASKGFYESGLSFYNDILTNKFDWQLLQELSPHHKNVLISPISLKLIFGLLYQGSTSVTEKEFQSLLNFENKDAVKNNYSNILAALQHSERSEYLLNIGTSMFLDKDLHVLPTFEQIAVKYFRTGIKLVDFGKPEEASQIINSWIDQLTHGKVKKMVAADDLVQTLMLITNAIYFKGTWEHPFPRNQTYVGKFLTTADYTQANKPPKYVQYMTTIDEFYYYEDPSLDAKIVRLEYKGSSYSMFIVLPNSLGGLENLIKKISLTKISEMRYYLTAQLVQLIIPKFKFNFHAKLAPILQKFGLHQIFQNTNSFNGIVQTNNSLRRQLVVSDIVQKTGIEVDEEGSVVFSATDVNIGNKFGENKLIFNASHPFMFFVEGPNGTILFIGKYEDPEEMEVSEDKNVSNGGVSMENSNNGNAQYYPNQNRNNQGSLPNNGFASGNRFNDAGPPVNSGAPTNLSPNLDPEYYQPADSNMEDVAYRFNLFDIELLNAFTDSQNNVLISPASIKTTLAMILEGASGNCAEEISEALRIPDITQTGARHIILELLNNLNEKGTANTFLESHNAIFTSNKQRLLDSYKKIIMQYYNADFKSLDFSNPQYAASVINQWASDSTHGNINEVISSQMISPETYVIISNALYFKGKWKTSFDERSTAPKCFHIPSKGCTQVQMMHISNNFNYNYINTLRAYVVEIPYQDKFSMLLILPSSDTNVRSIIRDLPHHRLTSILNNLTKSEIVLEIPKFSFEYSVDLVEYLKQLKIRDVFGPKANLSKIIQGNNALVNNLLHKTKIEVDEHGTVAAASTSAMIIPLMQPVTVSADRPFVFMIYHQETKNIIFEGIVQNPLEQRRPTYYDGEVQQIKTPLPRNNNFRNRARYN